MIINIKTSYLIAPLDGDGCRIVAVETAPLTDKTQVALGPCCEKDSTFDAMS